MTKKYTYLVHIALFLAAMVLLCLGFFRLGLGKQCFGLAAGLIQGVLGLGIGIGQNPLCHFFRITAIGIHRLEVLVCRLLSRFKHLVQGHGRLGNGTGLLELQLPLGKLLAQFFIFRSQLFLLLFQRIDHIDQFSTAHMPQFFSGHTDFPPERVLFTRKSYHSS